jgi:hypothetical protein
VIYEVGTAGLSRARAAACSDSPCYVPMELLRPLGLCTAEGTGPETAHSYHTLVDETLRQNCTSSSLPLGT